MKKYKIILFIASSIIFLQINTNQIIAQCTGESTGFRGECYSDDVCTGNGGTVDGHNGCAFGYQNCCIDTRPCTGETSGDSGYCHMAADCDAAGGTFDGQDICFIGECCINIDEPATPIEPFEPSLCPGDSPEEGYPGLMTALGCINTYPTRFLSSIRNILLSMAGGVAFILMIIGAFFILTSQGEPERLKRGKEIFFGALTGLIFLIFTWFLLNLITRDILRLR